LSVEIHFGVGQSVSQIRQPVSDFSATPELPDPEVTGKKIGKILLRTTL
jgi:hypothetical protein